MPYASRHNRGRFRHDPANRGIFIHGGTSGTIPGGLRGLPNQFTLSLPLRNRVDGPDIGDHRPSAPKAQPTFQRALRVALALRRKHALLAGLPIYACTDLIPETCWGGTALKFAVQRVA